jgi:modulator of FtsH protease
MYDYSRNAELVGYPSDSTTAERPAVLSAVLGLLGFASLFTAGGALIAPILGPSAVLISIVGSLATLLGLFVARDKAPLNLALLYAFATFEGLALGLILDLYVTNGLGRVVLDATLTTAVVTLVAGAYGYTTNRNVSGIGGILTVGLIGVLIASIVGVFVELPLLQIGISAVAAVLFTGFLVYDLNRVAQNRGATEGEIVLLAVSIYLDIFNLFLALLQLFGLPGRDE